MDSIAIKWTIADVLGLDSSLSKRQAKDKDSVLVFNCETHKEAEIVAKNAKDRGDMTKVKITQVEIEPRSGNNTHVRVLTKDDAPNWYEPNWFKKSLITHEERMK